MKLKRNKDEMKKYVLNTLFVIKAEFHEARCLSENYNKSNLFKRLCFLKIPVSLTEDSVTNKSGFIGLLLKSFRTNSLLRLLYKKQVLNSDKNVDTMHFEALSQDV